MHFVEEVILIEKTIQNETKAVDISIHLSAAQMHNACATIHLFSFHLSHFRDTLTHDWPPCAVLI